MTNESAVAIGLRERTKQARAARIFDAASELFLANGFSATTTQQIAERADVAEGTLFRYAATKVELLLMVVNAKFRGAVDAGVASLADRAPVRAGCSPNEVAVELTSCVAALLEPIIRHSIANGDNTLVYQKHVLFGDVSERYRAEALATIEVFIDEIARAIDTASDASTRPDARAVTTARVVFATMTLEFAKAINEGNTVDDVISRMQTSIDIAVRGYLSSRGSDVSQAPTTIG